MTTYPDLISQFFYEQFPLIKVSPAVRFEAVAAEVIGSKQRRFGPMPSPETQVAIRDVLRRSDKHVQFFLPWGSSKQADGMGIDVLEFSALKQLRCLQDGLSRMGVQSSFTFRVEDLTDRYLFGDGRLPQIETYGRSFKILAEAMLAGAAVERESMHTSWFSFRATADGFAPTFYKYLRGEVGVEALQGIGWQGTIPPEQREYYAVQYRQFYPEGDHLWEMARYFAATLTRVQQKATCAPRDEHLLIAFTHPVPGNPVNKTRLYYRTIPERYTNNHKSPWIGKGYFLIGEDNSCTPKVAGPYEKLDFQPNTFSLGGVQIGADYVVG